MLLNDVMLPAGDKPFSLDRACVVMLLEGKASLSLRGPILQMLQQDICDKHTLASEVMPNSNEDEQQHDDQQQNASPQRILTEQEGGISKPASTIMTSPAINASRALSLQLRSHKAIVSRNSVSSSLSSDPQSSVSSSLSSDPQHHVNIPVPSSSVDGDSDHCASIADDYDVISRSSSHNWRSARSSATHSEPEDGSTSTANETAHSQETIQEPERETATPSFPSRPAVDRRRRDLTPRSVLFTQFSEAYHVRPDEHGDVYLDVFEFGCPCTREHMIAILDKNCFMVETNHQDDVETTVGTYPLDKQLGPLSMAETHMHFKDLVESKTKELKSWHETATGKPVLAKDYMQDTGLHPLPSRWVIEWKLQEGKVIIKCRLCLKGFAESNQHLMHTYSPTATRLGHKMAAMMNAINGWELWFLEVPTAFLKGGSFEDMNKAGFARQPCAFFPPSDVYPIWAEFDKDFKKALACPKEWCVVLKKAADGLKDAPLLWNLCAVPTLTDELGGVLPPHLFNHRRARPPGRGTRKMASCRRWPWPWRRLPSLCGSPTDSPERHRRPTDPSGEPSPSRGTRPTAPTPRRSEASVSQSGDRCGRAPPPCGPASPGPPRA
jgi:hypothetical protein